MQECDENYKRFLFPTTKCELLDFFLKKNEIDMCPNVILPLYCPHINSFKYMAVAGTCL